MSVQMNKAQALDLMKQVMAQSYGSGWNEGSSGGAGSIGMIGGKPVKFNTHWTERFGKATPEMIKSSNELREALGNAAKALLSSSAPNMYKKISKKLGLDAEGRADSNKSLLSRTVAAQIISEIELGCSHSECGKEVTTAKNEGAKAAKSSKGVDTSFAACTPAGVAKQLKKSLTGFGKEMTFEPEDEHKRVETSLEVVKNNSVGTDAFRYIKTENTRQTKLILGDDVIAPHTFAPDTNDGETEIQLKLDKVFSQDGVVDTVARDFFLKVTQNGVTHGDGDRFCNDWEMSFPYGFSNGQLGSFDKVEQCISVKRLPNGSFRAEYTHTGNGVKFFHRMNGDGMTEPTKYVPRDKSDPKDFYSYTIAIEFSVDKDAKQVNAQVIGPKVTWNIGDHFQVAEE